MRFHHDQLPVVVLLVFTSQCHLFGVSASIPSTQLLEESVKLKLRTAAKLRDNLAKILIELPSTNYELFNSIELLRGFLKDGGSLIESLDVLPDLGYVTIDEQVNGILAAMENHSPRHLLPAIGVIRNDIRGQLNLEEILRSNDGPLKADLFNGILAQHLPKIAIPTPFPQNVERNTVEGPWPSYIGKTMSLITSGIVEPSGELTGLILANLKISTNDPEVKESVNYLAEILLKDQVESSELKPASDPYEFVKNAIVTIAGNDPTKKEAVETLLPCLKAPVDDNTKQPDLAQFYLGESLNYTLVVLNDIRLVSSKPGAMLLSAIQRGEINLNQALDGLLPHEYRTPRGLLIAVVSKLRRYEAHQGVISDVVESLYGELTQRYNHGNWRTLVRSPGGMRAMLHGMRTDPNSVRIRRLANDISASLEKNIAPEFWPKAVNHAPDGKCHGPSCLVLRTLEGLQEVLAVQDPAMNVSVVELLGILKRDNDMEISVTCPQLTTKDAFKDLPELLQETPDIPDLLQALPYPDVDSREYKALKGFLSREDLERELGEAIDTTAHSTRARLLAWLLRKVEKLDGVDEMVRKAARNWMDSVSYWGYGAAGVARVSS